jgi:hypothetical protein
MYAGTTTRIVASAFSVDLGSEFDCRGRRIHCPVMSGMIVVEGRRPVGLGRDRCPGGRVEPLSLSSVLLGLVAVIVVIKFAEFVSGKN